LALPDAQAVSSPQPAAVAGGLGVGARIVRLLNRYSFALALVLVVILLVGNLLSETGGFGLTSQLADMAPYVLAGIASTPAILSGGGGFDLTISPVMYLIGGIFVVWLVPAGLGGAVAIPLLLLAGAVVGAFNALLIMLLRVPPVVVTLSMYFVLLGVDLLVVPAPVSLSSSSWVNHLSGSVGPIPGAVFTIGAPLLIWFLLGLTPYRRTLLAVGSNGAAAFSAGVNVPLVRIVAFSLGGMFAAIGGLALLSLEGSVNAAYAPDYALLGFTAVALGGTSLWGGRGGVFGSLLGGAAIYLLASWLQILQVNASWDQVVYGSLLILAVVTMGIAQRGTASS
jgi:ribose transport system permease protein